MSKSHLSLPILKEDKMRLASAKWTSRTSMAFGVSPLIVPPKPKKRKSKIENYLASEHVVEKSNDKKQSAGASASLFEFLFYKFPIIETIAEYNFQRDLFYDIAAGITIGVQLLPKAMAYAMMAKLDKSKGVIVAMMCSFLYPLCGSTPFLSVGPDPIICLLIQRGLEEFGYSSAHYQELEMDCLSSHCPAQNNLEKQWKIERNSVMGLMLLMIVSIQLIINLFHAGFISNFLSKPIIDAFVCSAALIIMLKQLHYCLNVHYITSEGTFYENLIGALEFIQNDWRNFVRAEHFIVAILTFFTLLILFGLHYWAHSRHLALHKAAGKIPAILLVVLMGIGFTHFAEWSGRGHWFANGYVDLVGTVKIDYSLFFVWPRFKHSDRIGYHLALKYLPEGHHLECSDLFFKSLQIAFISYFCSIMVCRKLAVRSQRRSFSVEPNQEMLGLSIANFGSLMLGGFPCGGILAMSVAVTNTSARTRLWSFFCGLTILILAHTPITIALLAKLPKAVLAAIVIETVIPLINFSSVWSIGKVLKLDVLQYGMTMIFCCIYDINTGICVGVFVAVLILVYRGTRHKVGELGRIPNSVKFSVIDEHKEALIADQILVCRVYDSLCFTNWYSCEQVIESMMDWHQQRADLIAVIIDFDKCGDIDSTAAFGLFDFAKKNAKKGIAIRCAQCEHSVLRKLKNVQIENIHDCGVKYQFYDTDHQGVVDIVRHHRALHKTGSVHLSEAAESRSGGSTESETKQKV